MGAGKTTFCKALIAAWSDGAHVAEGSPSFAIAHEYAGGRTQHGLVHLDLYRLKDESELTHAGVWSYLWDDSRRVVIGEWLDRFADLYRDLLDPKLNQGRNIFRIGIQFDPTGPDNNRLLEVEECPC